MDQFIQFIKEIDNIVRNSEKESDILCSIKPILEDILHSPEDIPKGAFNPRKDRFADNLIYMPKDKVFSIIGSVWMPNQSTPIHDHLSWALIGVYEGEEEETIYERIDNNYKTKASSLKQVSKKINRKGHITVLGKEGIHKIVNKSDKPSSSIHIYGIDLGNTIRHKYDLETGEIGTFRTGYDSTLDIKIE